MTQTNQTQPNLQIHIKDSFPKDFIIAIDGFSCTGKGVTSRLVAKRLGLNYIDTGSMYRAYCLFFITYTKDIIQKLNQNLEFLLSDDFQNDAEIFEDLLYQTLELAKIEIYPTNHNFDNNKQYKYNLQKMQSKSGNSLSLSQILEIINVEQLNLELDNFDLRFDYCSDSEESELMLNGQFLKNQIRTPLIDKLVPIVAKIHYIRETVSIVQKSMKGVVMEGRDIGTVIFPKANLKVFMTASLEVRAMRRQLDYQKKGIQIELLEVSKSLQERDKQDVERESCPLIRAEEAILLDTTFTTVDEQVQKIVDWALEKSEANV